jgi:hypothetical protein
MKLTLSLILSCAIRVQAIYLPAEGITFKLPYDWVEVPASVMQERAEQLQKMMPSTRIPQYSHAYQPQGNQWFTYPYILVQILPGHVPQSELEHTEVGTILKKSGELLSALQNISSGKTFYDTENKKLWVESKATVNGYSICELLVMQAEQAQIVSFGFYSMEDMYSAWRPVFTHVANSITPDASVAYADTSSDWSDSPWFGAAIKGLMLFLLIIFFRWVGSLFFRKPKG